MVSIPTDLRGCARRFKSITFTDVEGAQNPGTRYRYTIVTKFVKEKSDRERAGSAAYDVPFYVPLEGRVILPDPTAGGEDKDNKNGDAPGVANVRVCVNKVCRRVQWDQPQTDEGVTTTSETAQCIDMDIFMGGSIWML